jgi:methylated-DNA-[protein]-cysteine S-methyltransferase
MRYIDYFESPLGLIECQASQKGITQVIFCGDQKEAEKKHRLTDQCIAQLEEYFFGERKTFDLPLNAKGTEFQQTVWQSLTTIPYGEVVSYGELAQQLNNPKAVRAVGGANGRNPISIIVPCHRVIGTNGTLTGYAGGVERKLWLLQHEGVAIDSHGAASSGQKQLSLGEVIHRRQDKTQYLQ